MRDYEHCETDRLVEPKWPQAGRIVAAFGLEPDASLEGCPMTHMDDQLAKHIKEMIRKITRKPTDNQEPPRSPEPTRPDRSNSPVPFEPSL